MKRLFQSSKVRSVKHYFRDVIINGILMSYITPLFMRKAILNLWGCKIRGSVHGHSTILTNMLTLGENSYINKNCFIGNGYEYVMIGKNVAIAYGVTMTTDNHLIDNEFRRGGN